MAEAERFRPSEKELTDAPAHWRDRSKEERDAAFEVYRAMPPEVRRFYKAHELAVELEATSAVLEKARDSLASFLGWGWPASWCYGLLLFLLAALAGWII